MCFRLFFICYVLTILVILAQGCSKIQKKTYTEFPIGVHQQAEKVCDNIDGSQFIVSDLRVWLKKTDEGEIELKHYKSILPDGYYFCSGNDGNSTIID